MSLRIGTGVDTTSAGLSAAERGLIDRTAQLEAVCAIVCFGRSGSVFLQSLLDGHPQIITIPGSFLLGFYDFWDIHGHDSTEQVIKNFGEHFAPLFDVTADIAVGNWKRKQPAIDLGFDSVGVSRDERVEVDRTHFNAVMAAILQPGVRVTRKLFFQAMHVAYTVALGRAGDLDARRIPTIVFQMHLNRPDWLLKLRDDFRYAHSIHMIREPLQTMGALFTHQCTVSVLQNSYGHGFSPLDAGSSYAVRLEDLHTHPESTLRTLCERMQIDWSDALLTSTYNGKKWWNLKGAEQLSGFSTSIIRKDYSGAFFRLDRYRLRVLYSDRCRYWGYPSKSYSKAHKYCLLPLLLLPFKMELVVWRKEAAQTVRRPRLNSLRNWYYTRQILGRAWLNLLRGHRRRCEVPLLQARS